MRSRPANWPAKGVQLSAIGNPQVQVAGQSAVLPVNVAVSATVHGYARLADVTSRPAYDAIRQPFLILSDFAIQPGFSGGPLVFSASNFCERFELAGMVEGGDPTGSNLSWAVPVEALLAAIREAKFGPLDQPQPPRRFPDTLKYAVTEPFLELVAWSPRIDDDPAPPVPTLRLTQGEATPLAITLRLANPTTQLVPTLSGGADLEILHSAPIEKLSSGPGLFQFQWQVRPRGAAEPSGQPRPLTIHFYSEQGRTGLQLPLRYVIAPPPQAVVTDLLESCYFVADPQQPIVCPEVPAQALAGLNHQLLARESEWQERLDEANRRQERYVHQILARESEWQERLDEANRWQERYVRFTEEIARLGVDEATLGHLQELLAAGAFAKVRERIDGLRQQMHAQLARIEYLEGQSYLLESLNYAAALPHLRRATELQPADLDYAWAYADALDEHFRYRAAVAIYQEILTWEHLEPDEQARVANQLGNTQQGLEDYRNAVALYDRAIDLMETLRQQLGERWPPGMANDLAMAFYNRAFLHWRREKADAALADFERSRQLALATASQTGSFRSLDNYLDAALAGLYVRTTIQPETASAAAQAAKTHVAELTKRYPTDRWPPGLQAKLQELLALCATVLEQDANP